MPRRWSKRDAKHLAVSASSYRSQQRQSQNSRSKVLTQESKTIQIIVSVASAKTHVEPGVSAEKSGDSMRPTLGCGTRVWSLPSAYLNPCSSLASSISIAGRQKVFVPATHTRGAATRSQQGQRRFRCWFHDIRMYMALPGWERLHIWIFIHNSALDRLKQTVSLTLMPTKTRPSVPSS